MAATVSLRRCLEGHLGGGCVSEGCGAHGTTLSAMSADRARHENAAARAHRAAIPGTTSMIIFKAPGIRAPGAMEFRPGGDRRLGWQINRAVQFIN